MSKPRVYLAGPIGGLSFENATDWRLHAAKFLDDHGIEAFSPMRSKRYLVLKTDEVLRDGYPEFPLSTDDAITARDRNDIVRSDAVLFFFPEGLTRVSIGSMIEFGWADAFRKPRIVVLDKLHDHCIVRGLIDFRAPSLDDALEMVVAVLKP